MKMFCVLCHKNCLIKEDLKHHLVVDHGVKHDADLLMLLPQMTEPEKVDLRKKLTERSSTKDDVSSKIVFWKQMEISKKRIKDFPIQTKTQTLNDTLDIFEEVLKDNYEESIPDSIDEKFENLIKQDEQSTVFQTKDSSSAVPRKRRTKWSKRIQWWRYVTFSFNFELCAMY